MCHALCVYVFMCYAVICCLTPSLRELRRAPPRMSAFLPRRLPNNYNNSTLLLSVRHHLERTERDMYTFESENISVKPACCAYVYKCKTSLIYYCEHRPCAEEREREGESKSEGGKIGATHRETPPPAIMSNKLKLDGLNVSTY